MQMTVEVFATGQRKRMEVSATGGRQTVTGEDILNKLANQPEPCFTVIQSEGRFAAVTPENEVFRIPGNHWAVTPEAAAESIREHYAAIIDHNMNGV